MSYSESEHTPHPSGDHRFAVIDKRLKRAHHAQDQLIEILHVAQDVFGYLSDDVLLYVAHALRLPPSRVYGVATFYHLFELSSPGEHTCTVCTGTACFVKGADEIVGEVAARYDVDGGWNVRRPTPHTAHRRGASARAASRPSSCSTVRCSATSSPIRCWRRSTRVVGTADPNGTDAGVTDAGVTAADTAMETA